MVPGQPVRRVMKIEQGAGGALRATIYSIDETDDPLPVTKISLNGSALKMTLDVNRGEWRDYHRRYQATVSPDGQSITGNWNAPGIPPMQMEFRRVSAAEAWPIPAVPASHFVTVAPGVRLEVVDWGGTGKPIVFLAGLGNTAHVFSVHGFARAFTSNHHVYGITRRGFGESSKPAPTAKNYDANRLGDDIVAVLDAMHIVRPVLIGHSIAGEELSSIGTRHPEKVSGLVYLDAGYAYALYDPGSGALERMDIDERDVKNDLARMDAGKFGPREAAMNALLNSDLAALKQDVRVGSAFESALSPAMQGAVLESDPVAKAIQAGVEKFAGPIHVPILAIYAAPHNWQGIFGSDKVADARAQEAEYADQLGQISTFKKHLPNAKIVTIPHADHYVWFSNRAQVERAIKAFLNSPS